MSAPGVGPASARLQRRNPWGLSFDFAMGKAVISVAGLGLLSAAFFGGRNDWRHGVEM